MEDKRVWSIKEIKGTSEGKRKFVIEWSEVKRDLRYGKTIVEAKNEDEAVELFWDGIVISNEVTGFEEGYWEDKSIEVVYDEFVYELKENWV